MARYILTISCCFLLLTLLSACTFPTAHIGVVEGNYRFNKGDFVGATVAYVRAGEILRTRSFNAYQRILYDLGNTYRALGEVVPAMETLEAVRGGEDAVLAFRREFNLGCMEYDRGMYQEAATHFIAALRINAASREAKMNLELAVRKAEAAAAGVGEGPSQTKKQQRSPAQADRILRYIHSKEEEVWESLRPRRASSGVQDW